jgi:endogenous inhibitor of DNA gyrase (YacG/DUF329 family)
MQRACPICHKLADSDVSADFPFCSERCRLMDLGNWSSEKYIISVPAFDESMFEALERQLSSDAPPSRSADPEADDQE